VLAVAAVPTALTVALEFVGLVHPSNSVRALCALPLGGAGAWVLIQSLRAEAADARRVEAVPGDAL
jgi:threonine/homoserine efflux transporter RhtA